MSEVVPQSAWIPTRRAMRVEPAIVLEPSSSSTELELVSRIFASWNQLDGLLRRLEALRSAAGSA